MKAKPKSKSQNSKQITKHLKRIAKEYASLCDVMLQFPEVPAEVRAGHHFMDALDGLWDALLRTPCNPPNPPVPCDLLGEAMQLVWNDHCSDTGCAPECIRVHGPKTSRITADFTQSNFAWQVAHALNDLGYTITPRKKS